MLAPPTQLTLAAHAQQSISRACSRAHSCSPSSQRARARIHSHGQHITCLRARHVRARTRSATAAAAADHNPDVVAQTNARGEARVAVFVSGGGSNLRALEEAMQAKKFAKLGVVVTNKATCGGAQFARDAGVPVVVYPPPKTAVETDDEVAEDGVQLVEALQSHGVNYVLLAGYLKLIPEQLVAAYTRRILNIHPALLPSPFGGKGMYGQRVHAAVLESGAKVCGCTVHFVDEEYDRGAILGQRTVDVLQGDTAEDLAKRVLAYEHKLFPWCAQALCEDRVQWDDQGVPWIVDDK